MPEVFVIEFWHWWILGVALLVLEVFVPGTFFLWIGISAGVVGVLLMLFPDLGWQYQVLVFAALSVASVVVWRTWLRKDPPETDHPTLNRRGQQYVGRVFTLTGPIVNGHGRTKVDDSMWMVHSATDAAVGDRVKVVGLAGTTLQVEPYDASTAA